MYANGTVDIEPIRAAAAGLRASWRGLLGAALAATIAITAPSASAVAHGGGPLAARPSPSEDQGLEAAVAALLSQATGNRQLLIAAGQAALARGRDEATVAGFLRLRWSGPFNAALERYARLLGSPDATRLALGVAGVEHYSELIHNRLLHNGPDRMILVSVQAQRLLAYDHGKVILDTQVTTGRAALPTDIGAMQVVKKDAPWTMHSPWPKGSPYWYPDTEVRIVAWFTRTGEGLHDAAWEPLSAYGPGSENGPFASHGCIHLPPAAEAILFPWAAIGTPVVVYPGDGTPVAVQAAQQSVDAAGNPIVSDVRGD
jgi:L,D-transpeptidase-like protein